MDNEKIQLTQEVIDGINGELEYQNQLAGSARADKTDSGVIGQIATAETYLAKARDEWVLNRGDDESLEQIRKVTATLIRALVRFGCPTRK
jgi:hypothetical protein